MIEPSEDDLKLFLENIKKGSDYDFSDYSMNSLKRRVIKLLNDYHIELNQLSEKVLSDKVFMEVVAKRITVNTTELFRDPKMWLTLQENVLSTFKKKDKINIWHSGCSTGQEVYSMMMLLHEMNLLDKAEIYATDINTDVMKTAKTGVYKYRFNQEYLDSFETVINNGKNEKNKIPYTRYFFIDKIKDTFQMKQFLVKKPVYKKVDLVREGCPFDIKFDLIVCRNVIIYFNYELQNKVFQMFHNCLKPEACLMLGWHESIVGTMSVLFDKKNQLYFKK